MGELMRKPVKGERFEAARHPIASGNNQTLKQKATHEKTILDHPPAGFSRRPRLVQLRKIIKTRGHFPSDDAASKLIWLALRNITADWGRAAKDWKDAMNQFAILYAERFEAARG